MESGGLYRRGGVRAGHRGVSSFSGRGVFRRGDQEQRPGVCWERSTWLTPHSLLASAPASWHPPSLATLPTIVCSSALYFLALLSITHRNTWYRGTWVAQSVEERLLISTPVMVLGPGIKSQGGLHAQQVCFRTLSFPLPFPHLRALARLRSLK